MSLRIRFTLLIFALFGALLFAVTLLHQAEQREQTVAVTAAQAEAEQSWRHLITLNGESFDRFMRGYSWWDDMSTFIEAQDAAWAHTHLPRALPFNELSSVWVTDAAGKPIHQVTASDDQPVSAMPSPEALLEIGGRDPFARWFEQTASGIVEMRLAPIQPSSDRGRATAPRGWLVAARRWDQRQLARLVSVFGGSATLVGPHATPSPQKRAMIQVDYPLADANGRTIALLRIARSSPYLEVFAETDQTEAKIFIGFSIAFLAVVVLALQRWILGPLGTINDSLRTRETRDLQRLRQCPDEVGGIAQEVARSFAREQELQHEVLHRKEITESLRQVIDERILLGRNLHDSVIQTIYASGLGLAATRSLLHTDPSEAERRLLQVHGNLNETIRELRTYITGLEPESLPAVRFQETMQNVVDALQPPKGWAANLDADEAIVARLPAETRVQLLQILREALSNAARHGQANSIRITVAAVRNGVALTITDDGTGFAPNLHNLGGKGLSNMRARAHDLGGKLDIISDPGKGTSLLLTLPLPPSIK